MALTKNILFFCLFIMISNPFAYAQKKPVRLIEEKLKKKTILYVQNDTNSEKSAFLKVNPIGYRRSANKPILKIIPPKSKVQMIILIPLTDVESHYTYDLIINDNLKTIEAKRKHKN